MQFTIKDKEYQCPIDLFTKSNIFDKIKKKNEFDEIPYYDNDNKKAFNFKKEVYYINDEDIEELIKFFESLWFYKKALVDFDSLVPIKVNIRGKEFVTTEATLRKSKLFTKVLNEEIKPAYYKQAIFFDRCPKMFAELLNYMTDNEYFIKKKYHKNIRREAEFYGVDVKIPVKYKEYNIWNEHHKGFDPQILDNEYTYPSFVNEKTKDRKWKLFGPPLMSENKAGREFFKQYVYKTTYNLE